MNLRSTIYSGVISKKTALVACLSATLVLSSCASWRKAPGAPDGPKDEAQVQITTQPAEPTVSELSATVAQLNKRLEIMDERYAQLTDKLSSMQTNLENTAAVQKNKASSVTSSPSDHAGVAVGDADEEPVQKAAFANNPAIEKFRSAKILFDSGKYPEAMLEFNTFLKAHTDHAFAPAAQFYMGECYFNQGEFKLASEEYQHLLSGFDQSSYVPDALKRLSQVEEKLKMTKMAARHRQLLLSLFPQSPAAREALETKSLPATDSGLSPAISEKLHSKAESRVPVTETIKVLSDKEISVGDMKFPAVQVEQSVPTAPVAETETKTEHTEGTPTAH